MKETQIFTLSHSCYWFVIADSYITVLVQLLNKLANTCCFLHVIIAGKVVLEGKCSEITLFGTRFKYNLAILDTFEFKL